jgi:hypothetical protein
MPDDKHPFDAAAERLEAAADTPVEAQDASPDYWELKFATDESVGDYPQAMSLEEQDWDESEEDIDESDGIGADGFPMLPSGLPKLELQSTAKWTDVLSSSLWSGGYLLNHSALAPFKQCSLGDFREYPALVRDTTGSERSYTYVFLRNIIEPAAIDFERSEFYIEDILGIPKAPIDVNSFDDWLEMLAKANAGDLDGIEEFSSLAYKKLFFRHGHTPSVDLFTFARLGVGVYISARLKDAIVNSGITGLEIKQNKRVFANQ